MAMGGVFSTFAETKGLDMEDCDFTWGGRVVRGHDTPASLGMHEHGGVLWIECTKKTYDI